MYVPGRMEVGQNAREVPVDQGNSPVTVKGVHTVLVRV